MAALVPLGRYLLARRLAVGGMAEVFLAYINGPEGFRKPVVIKRLLPHLAGSSDIVALFLNEARLAARFDHPNLIQVYELFEAAGQYCIAMELLDGLDLHELLSRTRGRIAIAAALEIIADAAAGLHYAHEMRDESGEPLGVVHRDVSPTNIFVTRAGAVKVVDFGIAKQAESQRSTSLRGKPAYMAPEQLNGEPFDRRADVFALGAVAYELVSGVRCFASDDLGTLVRNVTSGTRRPLSTVAPDAPVLLVEMIDRMLEVDVEHRTPTCEAVRRESRRVLGSLSTSGHELHDIIDPQVFDNGHGAMTRVPTALLDPTLAEVSGALESPTLEVPERRPGRTDDALPSPAPLARRPRRRYWPYVVAIVVITVITVIGGILAPPRAPPSVAIAAASPAAVAPPPAVAITLPPVNLEPIANATLTLTSTPAAEVYLRGKPLGRTPLRAISVPSEKLTLVLKNVVSGSSKTLPLQLAPGSTTTKHVDFAKGMVVIDAKPWADVYLGAQKLGVTPLPQQSLYEGDYVFELRNPSLPKPREVTIRIRPGQTTKVFETLAQ